MSEPDHKSVAIIERENLPEKMHPVVRAALEHNPDPATLRELLAVQREWEAGEAKRAFTRALVDLKRDLPTVLDRDKTVAFTTKSGQVRYTHTSLAAVMNAVTEPLTQHGFSIAWTPTNIDGVVYVTCRLTHAEGHAESTTLSSPTDRSGSKSEAQGVASTITLLSRYSVLALLGIATADMKEPQGEPPPDHVDSKQNLRAVKSVVDAGRTREDAEEMIERPVQQWTAADIHKLRDWLPKSEQLKTALGAISEAADLKKLETVGEQIKASRLSAADAEQAKAAYVAKRTELT